MSRSFEEVQAAQVHGLVVPSREFYEAYERWLLVQVLICTSEEPEWPELEHLLPHVQTVNASTKE